MMDEFESVELQTEATSIFLRRMGSGPAVLLLHGFPQTHLMWRDIAPLLALQFTVVCPDLRGYGQSGCPDTLQDHSPYSKRSMAKDMISVMDQLGFSSFSVAGHDRGGRVAYRLALDHPDRVQKLAVLDIIPTLEVWERVDARFAVAFWPWSLFAQPAPFPEKLISAAPSAIVDDALNNWGTPISAFTPEVIAAYVEALQDPHRVKAICEEYRAAATIDREHDADDRNNTRQIQCPVLALWSADSALDTWYAHAGGPLGIWRSWGTDVRGRSFKAGHFFPEELPEQTASELIHFFSETTD